jgi:hypothetical protein
MEDQNNKETLSLLDRVIKELEDPEKLAEAKAFFKKSHDKRDMEGNQAKRLLKRFKDDPIGFDVFVKAVKAKYDSEAYNDRSKKLGHYDAPEPLIYLIFDAAQINNVHVPEEDMYKFGGMFTQSAYILHGYVCELIVGQGSFVLVQTVEEFYSKYFDINSGKYGEWIDAKTDLPITRNPNPIQEDLKLEQVKIKQMDTIPGFDGFTEDDKDKALGA